MDPEAAKVFAYWTPERIKSAIPHELFVDEPAPIREDVIDPLLTSIPDKHWKKGGIVQKTVGRIYYAVETEETPFVCSGTVVTDSTSGRSIILTAAHCVYDKDTNGFSYNSIFIPNQDDGGSDQTDWKCTNDPFGCWALNFAVIDQAWVLASNNSPSKWEYDYAFYVVADSGRHLGKPPPDALDVAVGTLPISFAAPIINSDTFMFGYPGNNDPELRYCVDPLGTYDNYWTLPKCDVRQGASGGPLIQPMNEGKGSGPIIGVNSFSFSSAGIYSPKLAGTSAECLFNIAKKYNFSSVVNKAVVVNSATDCPKNSVVFREDFLGTNLNTNVWTVETGKLDRTVLGQKPVIATGVARWTFDTFGFKGTEIYTKQRFSRGTKGLEIEVKMKLVTPLPSGLVANVYTWAKNPSGSIDEIDINILSKQLNVASGKALVLESFDNYSGSQNHPFYWSSSKAISDVGNWHTYVIRWLPERTYWLIDGKVVEDTNKVKPDADSFVGLLFYAPDSGWDAAYDKNFQPAKNSASNQRYYVDIDYVEVRQLM